MATMRVTTFFTQADFGWSETWWKDGSNYGSLAAGINSMLDARKKMLSTRVSFGGVRLATEGLPRTSRLLLPGSTNVDGNVINIPASGDRLDNTSSNAGPNRETFDQVRSCLQVEVVAFGQRLSRRYLCGIPDQVSKTEPEVTDYTNPPLWWEAFNSWEAIVRSHAWRVKYMKGDGEIPIGPIVGWVRQGAAPELWGAVTLNAATIGAVQGSHVMVRGVRMRLKGLRSPNGEQVVDSKVVDNVAGTTTFYLRQTQGLDLSLLSSLGDIRVKEFAYVVPSRLMAYSVGVHKRGGPFRKRVGRRSTPRFVN